MFDITMRKIESLEKLSLEVCQLSQGFRNFYIQVEGVGHYWYRDFLKTMDDFSKNLRLIYESDRKDTFKTVVINEFEMFYSANFKEGMDETIFYEKFYDEVLLRYLGLFYQQTELLSAYSYKKLKKFENEEYSLQDLKILRDFLRDESNHLKSQMNSPEIRQLLLKELLTIKL